MLESQLYGGTNRKMESDFYHVVESVSVVCRIGMAVGNYHLTWSLPLIIKTHRLCYSHIKSELAGA
jgi:hypothetical protein